MQVPLIRLQCGVNSYEWGKPGKDSCAAKYAAATPSDNLTIQDDKPYAELWMGTHPSLPSKDLETKRTLLDMVQENQSLMSQEITLRYGGKLPFLFKVLSIGKALSIQAHPNKKLAEELHAKDPTNYPDDNHKPEMTIAITEFEGLCGFRPLNEISHFLAHVTSFRQLVGGTEASEFEQTTKSNESETNSKQALRAAFSSLMKSSKQDVEEQAKALVEAAEKEGSSFAGSGGPSNTGSELAELVIRLNKQFSGDIGLFNLFFLNYVKLAPGEALFLKADDIHAYISGDIVECMASSDNVVRAGFTPKFKDIETLTSMLTYSYAPIEEQKMDPVDYPYVTLNTTAYSSNSTSLLYDPPIEEFSVVRTELKRKGGKATFEALAGPSIIICSKGEGKISIGPKSEVVKEGYVFFVGATAECVLESTEDEQMVTFNAFCEVEERETNGANGHRL